MTAIIKLLKSPIKMMFYPLNNTNFLLGFRRGSSWRKLGEVLRRIRMRLNFYTSVRSDTRLGSGHCSWAPRWQWLCTCKGRVPLGGHWEGAASGLQKRKEIVLLFVGYNHTHPDLFFFLFVEIKVGWRGNASEDLAACNSQVWITPPFRKQQIHCILC